MNRWVTAYLSNGLEGLNRQPRVGRACRLTESQLTELGQFIETHSVKKEGGRLITDDVRRYIYK